MQFVSSSIDQCSIATRYLARWKSGLAVSHGVLSNGSVYSFELAKTSGKEETQRLLDLVWIYFFSMLKFIRI